jgi:YD repeat-containing protein
MAFREFSMRVPSALTLVLVMLLMSIRSVTAQTVVPPTPPPQPPDPKPCTLSDGRQTTCVDLRVSRWKYLDMSGQPYGGQISGEYDGLQPYLAAVASFFSARGFCYFSYSNIQPIFGIDYTYGLPYRKYLQFDVTLGTNPNCTHSLAGGDWIQLIRTVDCPQDFSAVQQGSGYACACNPNADCAPPRCPKGAVRKANPCDALSGNKVQTEVDYRAAGSFPLEFVRGYNSGRLGFVPSDQFSNPIGTGWLASYLQTLRYSESTSRPGVYAYRPDGSMVIFYANGGTFSVGDEVGDKLEWIYQSGVQVGLLYTTPADVKERYDLDGRLQSLTSRGGIVQTLSYNALGYVQSVTDSFGAVMQFTWTPGSPASLASVTLPDGGVISFGYGANNNLTSVTYPDATQRTYQYELTDTPRLNLLTGITDESNVRYSTWGYLSNGKASSSEHAGGLDHYAFSYNTTNGNRVVTDPLGTVHTYSTSLVANQRRYTSSDAACGGCSEWASATYDALGNFDTRTDFNGSQTKTINDLTRNLEIYRADAYGTTKVRAAATTWDPTYRLPSVVTESGRTTAYSYDGSGNVLTRTVTDTKSTPNVSRVWTYTWNGFGQMLTEDDPRTDVSDVTTYTYYSCATGYQCGRVHTVTDALSHTSTFLSYNAHGQPLTMTDANGVTSTLAYDARQRMTSRTVGGETTSFSYWPTGLLKRTTLPDGSYLESTYDNAHRLTQVVDGEGNKISYTLDAMGNRTAESAYDPSLVLARTGSKVFNSLNQLWKAIGAAGTSAVTTSLSYDANGNQTSTSAPLGRSTVNAYDELNRVAQITDPALGITVLGYDAADNLVSMLDPKGLTTSYTYNGFGEVTVLSSPDTGTTTSTYDPSGSLATKIDARGLTGTYGFSSVRGLQRLPLPSYRESYF